MQKRHSIEAQYMEMDHLDDLDPDDKELFVTALNIRKNAYAPYSNFKVGAAVSLNNSEIIAGSNKENSAFPAGICAERNALFSAMDRYPGSIIYTIAIVADPATLAKAIPTPCGTCRQVLCEVEGNQERNIRVIMGSERGRIILFDSASDLLPLYFLMKNAGS